MSAATLPALRAAWPAPPWIEAGTTTRGGGVSAPPFATLNLGFGVGDDPAAVAANRERLARHVGAELVWLRQVHGRTVAAADPTVVATADGCVTAAPGRACLVLTADCLPVLLTTTDGTRIGAAHAGWRGLAGGILEAAVDALAVRPDQILAWLGPAISGRAYQVGADVYDAFVRRDPGAACAFEGDGPGHWRADLQGLARRRLAAAGVTAVFGGEHCVHSEGDRFFSYRRDGRTGRMASWIVMRAR